LPVTPHASQARAAVCSPRPIHLIMLVKWTIRTPVRRPFRRSVRLLLNGRVVAIYCNSHRDRQVPGIVGLKRQDALNAHHE
jgi:hypothetical protein